MFDLSVLLQGTNNLLSPWWVPEFPGNHVCLQAKTGPLDVLREPLVAVSDLSSSLLTEAHFHSRIIHLCKET